MNIIAPTEKDMSDFADTVKSVLGVVENAERFFDEQKKELFKKLGDLSFIQPLLNRIVVAVWVRPDHIDLGDGKKLYRTDAQRDEDIWQGVVGLVVAMGPLAFQSDSNFDFREHEHRYPVIGDWVLYHRQGYSARFRHNGVDCLMMESEKPIKAILTRPDLVE